MRGTILLRCSCLASWLAVCVGAACGQQAPIIAHVLDLKGTWRVDGSSALLARGQGLPEGAKIVATSNHPGDMITVVRAQDLSRLQVVCDATPADPCRTPLVIQSSSAPPTPATSQVATLVHAAFSLLMGSSPATASQYAVTMTRSFPAEKLQEAVIALSHDGTLALPHSPGGIPVGDYTLLIVPVGSSAGTQQKAVLNPGGNWQAIPFTTPGLCQISVRDAQDHHIANVMLLVTKEDQAEKASAAFEDAKSHTETWAGPNARRDEHLFLRAFLQSESNAL
jgi:hypothetical protein